jgi:hypothetical protein
MSFRNKRIPVRNPLSLPLSSRLQRTVRPANRPRSRGTLVFYFHPRDQKRVRVPHFSLFLREVGTTIRQNQEPAGITFAEAFFADTFHRFPIWEQAACGAKGWRSHTIVWNSQPRERCGKARHKSLHHMSFGTLAKRRPSHQPIPSTDVIPNTREARVRNLLFVCYALSFLAVESLP